MIGITQEVLKQKIKQNKLSPSGYSPSVEVKKLDGLIIADLQIGYQWLTRTWEEFNNRTLQEEMNETTKKLQEVEQEWFLLQENITNLETKRQELQ